MRESDRTLIYDPNAEMIDTLSTDALSITYETRIYQIITTLYEVPVSMLMINYSTR